MKRLLISLSALLGLIVVALLIYLLPRAFKTGLTFRFEDAVSHSWVWDATVTLQGKEIRSFYQSNTGPREYTFTSLRPGRATLRISAPNYETRELPIRLHIGANRIATPIAMTGYRIPDLTKFTMVESQEKGGLAIEIRPVDSAGRAIVDHPCLNLWVGVFASVEMAGPDPARESLSSGATRGDTLFRGRIPWRWDDALDRNFRYHASLPYSALSDRSAPYLVIDYLVIVPDPRKISDSELDSIMRDAPGFSAVEQLAAYLDAHREQNQFQYYFATSWNVPGPGLAS